MLWLIIHTDHTKLNGGKRAKFSELNSRVDDHCCCWTFLIRRSTCSFHVLESGSTRLLDNTVAAFLFNGRSALGVLCSAYRTCTHRVSERLSSLISDPAAGAGTGFEIREGAA